MEDVPEFPSRDPAENVEHELARDRRRPNRMRQANPALVPLLRNPLAAPHENVSACEFVYSAKKNVVIEINTPAERTAIQPEDIDPLEDEIGRMLSPSKGIAAGVILSIPIWAAIAAGAWYIL